MALNTSKCNPVMTLGFKGLRRDVAEQSAAYLELSSLYSANIALITTLSE